MIQLLFLVPTDQLPELQVDYFAISAAANIPEWTWINLEEYPQKKQSVKKLFVIPGLYKSLK